MIYQWRILKCQARDIPHISFQMVNWLKSILNEIGVGKKNKNILNMYGCMYEWLVVWLWNQARRNGLKFGWDIPKQLE